MARRVVKFIANTDTFADNFSIFDDNRASRKTALRHGLFRLFYCLLEKLLIHICILAVFRSVL